MKLSIVTTLYKSEQFVREFYSRTISAASALCDAFEIIFVNDGSPDSSLDLAQRIAMDDPRVIVVNLARNFGQHKALMTGLSYATGDRVFVIDSDLEDPPELLSEFWRSMSASSNVDVVYGVQEKRGGGLLRRRIDGLFYKVFNSLSDVQIPENLLIVRLMTAAYVRSLLRFTEAHLVIAGAYVLTGFVQRPYAVTRSFKDTTTYNFSRKVALLVDTITSFSIKPLIWIFYAGCVISCISLCGIGLLGYKRFVLHHALEGWTSVVASIWLFGGMIIFGLGIVGVYVAKTYIQTKNRPFTIVRDVFCSRANAVSERILDSSNLAAGNRGGFGAASGEDLLRLR